MVDAATGVPEACQDVLWLEIGMLVQDLVGSQSRGEQIEDVDHTDAQATNARATPAAT